MTVSEKVFTRSTEAGSRRCEMRNRIENLLQLAAVYRPEMGADSKALPFLQEASSLLSILISEIQEARP